MDRLAAMECFVRIVEAGSLTAAARISGRSLATTVRTLAALESHLGARLLERTTRSLRLTDEGADYLERSRAVLRLADEADAAPAGRRGRLAGRLTISAPSLFGRLHIAPVVLSLLQKEKGLSAHLLLTDRVVDLIEDGVDVAVRIGHLPDSSLRATAFGSTRWMYCASPSYLRRRGTPKRETDLARHDVLNLAAGAAQQAGPFSCNSADVLVQAAIEGRGIVRVLSYQVFEEIRRAKLREVLGTTPQSPVPISVVHSCSKLQPARVLAFRDAVLALRGRMDFI